MTPDIHLYDGDVFLDATSLLKASTRALTLCWEWRLAYEERF